MSWFQKRPFRSRVCAVYLQRNTAADSPSTLLSPTVAVRLPLLQIPILIILSPPAQSIFSQKVLARYSTRSYAVANACIRPRHASPTVEDKLCLGPPKSKIRVSLAGAIQHLNSGYDKWLMVQVVRKRTKNPDSTPENDVLD